MNPSIRLQKFKKDSHLAKYEEQLIRPRRQGGCLKKKVLKLPELPKLKPVECDDLAKIEQKQKQEAEEKWKAWKLKKEKQRKEEKEKMKQQLQQIKDSTIEQVDEARKIRDVEYRKWKRKKARELRKKKIEDKRKQEEWEKEKQNSVDFLQERSLVLQKKLLKRLPSPTKSKAQKLKCESIILESPYARSSHPERLRSPKRKIKGSLSKVKSEKKSVANQRVTEVPSIQEESPDHSNDPATEAEENQDSAIVEASNVGNDKRDEDPVHRVSESSPRLAELPISSSIENPEIRSSDAVVEISKTQSPDHSNDPATEAEENQDSAIAEASNVENDKRDEDPVHRVSESSPRLAELPISSSVENREIRSSDAVVEISKTQSPDHSSGEESVVANQEAELATISTTLINDRSNIVEDSSSESATLTGEISQASNDSLENPLTESKSLEIETSTTPKIDETSTQVTQENSLQAPCEHDTQIAEVMTEILQQIEQQERLI